MGLTVAYVRASTQEQAKYGNTVEAQIDMIKEYAKFNKYELKDEHIFVDRGKTGLNEKRPAYQEMLNLVYSAKVKTIIIKKSDRMSRNVKHREKMMENLSRLGVRIIGVQEHISWDTADDRETERIKAARHQGESERTGERTKDCLNAVVRSGRYPIGDDKAPFGYRRVEKKLVVHVEEALVIQDIFNKIGNENYTVDKCLIYLRINNIADRKWHLYTFMKLVKNPIYFGTLHFPFNNPRLIIPNHSPAIISEELFNKVQESMKKRRKEHKYTYIAKNQVMCSCGNMMIQHSTLKKIKGKRNKIPYLYYVCNTCSVRVNQKLLQEKICYFLNEENKQTEYIEERNELVDKVSKIEKLLMLYSNMFIDNQLEIEELEKQFKKLSKDLVVKRKLIKKLEKKSSVNYYAMSQGELATVISIKVERIIVTILDAKNYKFEIILCSNLQ